MWRESGNESRTKLFVGGGGDPVLITLAWQDSPTVVAVEVIRVVGVVLKDQGLLLDDGVTLLADVLAQAAGFLTVVARPTQVPEVRGGRRVRNYTGPPQS